METKNLQKLGLSEEESAIYSYIIGHGKSKALDISIACDIKRSFTYKVIEGLISKNLIEKREVVGAVTEFYPLHPQNLYNLVESEKRSLEEKTKEIEIMVPHLASLFNLTTGRPHVEFYEGESGVWKILNDSLTAAEMIYQYLDIETMVRCIPRKIDEEYVKKRKKAGIEKQIIIPDSEYSRNFISPLADQTGIKIITGMEKVFKTTTMIYDGKVSYINFKDNIMIAAIIEDSEYYYFQKAIFEHLWRTTPKL